jgi:transposase-like protein
MILLMVIALMALGLWIVWRKPSCPKCGSDDIGIFNHHDKQVFTCHECGHRDDENKL